MVCQQRERVLVVGFFRTPAEVAFHSQVRDEPFKCEQKIIRSELNGLQSDTSKKAHLPTLERKLGTPHDSGALCVSG